MPEIMSSLRSLTLLAGLAAFAIPASAVTIDWAFVGDPGNASDTSSNCFAPNCGSVAYDYSISRTRSRTRSTRSS